MNEEINKIIIKWWKKNKRDLPWRKEKNPYNIWVSEIMLQQTKVATVIPYFERFIKEIPDIETLASIKEEKLLKLWEGLGYYSRVKNMQKCAQKLVEEGKNDLPQTYKELQNLPGIGPYTAGAIASIAYQEKVCAVDGNVLRVVSRIENSWENISTLQVRKNIQTKLNKNMPEESGNFNEAIMELGALICIPVNPRCNICPVSSLCKAYQKHTMYKLPIKEKKKAKIEENVTVFLLTYKGKIAIRKRKDTGLLASLFEFPNVMEEIEEEAIQKMFDIEKIKKMIEYKHVFTHKIWNMTSYQIELKEKPKEKYLWVSLSTLEKKYTLPSAFTPFLKELEKKRKRPS